MSINRRKMIQGSAVVIAGTLAGRLLPTALGSITPPPTTWAQAVAAYHKVPEAISNAVWAAIQQAAAYNKIGVIPAAVVNEFTYAYTAWLNALVAAGYFTSVSGAMRANPGQFVTTTLNPSVLVSAVAQLKSYGFSSAMTPATTMVQRANTYRTGLTASQVTTQAFLIQNNFKTIGVATTNTFSRAPKGYLGSSNPVSLHMIDDCDMIHILMIVAIITGNELAAAICEGLGWMNRC
jgi:hypothetical protein